jgi:hypothetical protein
MIIVIESLDSVIKPDPKDIYLVATGDPTNPYEQYVYSNGEYHKVGTDVSELPEYGDDVRTMAASLDMSTEELLEVFKSIQFK